MIIPIRYSVKYKNYPYAPKATRKSMMLGYLTCVPMQVMAGFFWICIAGAILGYEDAGMTIAMVSLIPFYIVINYLKKRRSEKIDDMAKMEIYHAMMKNQPSQH